MRHGTTTQIQNNLGCCYSAYIPQDPMAIRTALFKGFNDKATYPTLISYGATRSIHPPVEPGRDEYVVITVM